MDSCRLRKKDPMKCVALEVDIDSLVSILTPGEGKIGSMCFLNTLLLTFLKEA